MAKRILSVILVLVVFFGGYAVLPKKYNPLPTENVCAAGVAGAYRIKKYGVVDVKIIKWTSKNTFRVYNGTFEFQPSSVGNIISLDSAGNVGTSGILQINMNTALKNGYLEKVY